MSLIRLIVIALIVYLVIQIFKRWAANKKRNASPSMDKQKNMVKCDVCQLHIPEEDALQRDNKYFCSQAHLDSDQK